MKKNCFFRAELCAILQQMAKIKAKSERTKRTTFDPSSIELKWQAKWDKEGIYQPDLDAANGSAKVGTKSPKKGSAFYNLMMFPYPSAEGLHVGSFYTF